MTTSDHQRRVFSFMRNAGQTTPDSPKMPDADVRERQARLILEEALETVEALGFRVRTYFPEEYISPELTAIELEMQEPNLVEIADGCADMSVVAMGTLLSCGIDDVELLKEVDESNLRKFGEGSYRREDGKWMKPPDWEPPNIQGVLDALK